VDTLEILNSVNYSQINEMERAAKQLDPSKAGTSDAFGVHVRNVQAAIIHTYQMTAFASLRQEDPADAAMMWRDMTLFCDKALAVLKSLKDKYASSGTAQLYDLALDYRSEAQKRYHQNFQDSECAKTPMPEGLFPTQK
jgi:hypothetical protein